MGSPARITNTVEKNLGTGGGWVVAAGETVTSLLTAPGSIAAVGSCTVAGGVPGSTLFPYTTLFRSAVGTSTLSASVSLTVSGVPLTRSLGDTNVGDSAKPTK